VGGWVDGWVGVKAVLRIAYSNQKANGKFKSFVQIERIKYKKKRKKRK
jgi:hypothetical protein